jgi:hypothetical protein
VSKGSGVSLAYSTPSGSMLVGDIEDALADSRLVALKNKINLIFRPDQG